MTDMSGHGAPGDIGHSVEIVPLEIEDLAQVRYIHASSFRLIASPYFTEDEITAFVARVTSKMYSDDLVAAMREQQLFGARFHSELIGTVGWSYGEDQGESARLRWLFVRPMFNDSGVGRRLVTEIELKVVQAGFKQISVRSTTATAPFFDRLGYHTTSHGVHSLSPKVAMPVVFMRKALTLSESVAMTHH